VVRLTVPTVPPSSNHAYVTVRGGKRILSAAGTKYKTETTAHLVMTFPRELRAIVPNTPLAMYVRFYFTSLNNAGWPTRTTNRYKHFDVSNRIKLFEDSLKDAAAYDDEQHMIVVAQKCLADAEKTVVDIYNLALEPFVLQQEDIDIDQYRR